MVSTSADFRKVVFTIIFAIGGLFGNAMTAIRTYLTIKIKLLKRKMSKDDEHLSVAKEVNVEL